MIYEVKIHIYEYKRYEEHKKMNIKLKTQN